MPGDPGLRVPGPDRGARLGAERRFFRPRSLLEAGIPLALGSDGPPNPWLDVMLAVVHPTAPSEAITVEQAVAAYMRGPAYAEFREAEREKVGITDGLVRLSAGIEARGDLGDDPDRALRRAGLAPLPR